MHEMYSKRGPIRQKKRSHSCGGCQMMQISASSALMVLDGLSGHSLKWSGLGVEMRMREKNKENEIRVTAAKRPEFLGLHFHLTGHSLKWSGWASKMHIST